MRATFVLKNMVTALSYDFTLRSCRPDDVRYKFERYGEIRDVYLPRDYYSKCVPFGESVGSYALTHRGHAHLLKDFSRIQQL